jgi:hypothetical protein
MAKKRAGKEPKLSAADKSALRRVMKKVRAIKIWKLSHK